MSNNNQNSEKEAKRKGILRSIIDGSFLSREIVFKNIWFIVFLVFLGLIYIANRNHAEKIVRETVRLKKEVDELKSEQLSITSTLMKISQQSQVESLVVKYNLDLVSSEEPPYKITVACPK
ncbi:MAG: FtsL-like putative cell division protein [Bacteroidales bacterium]|nr:FtsL-like putative cell division protein [Bacteroidales bacterium]